MATIFNLKPGETSSLIEGKGGVYMVELITLTTAELPENTKEKEDILLIKAVTNTDNLRSSIEQQYQNALYKAYDVKDYRLKQKITPSQDNR